jgi:hypothetical protein
MEPAAYGPEREMAFPIRIVAGAWADETVGKVQPVIVSNPDSIRTVPRNAKKVKKFFFFCLMFVPLSWLEVQFIKMLQVTSDL